MAIRAKCVECSGNVKQVSLCELEDCALWPFRMGVDPYRKKMTLSEEEKERRRKQFDKVRKNKKGKE